MGEALDFSEPADVQLPAPEDGGLAQGILDAIDMDKYRVARNAAIKIALADKDAEIASIATDTGGHKPESEMDRLCNILKTFNEQFGTLFNDGARVAQRIRDHIAPKVAADAAYQNAKENTPHTARIAYGTWPGAGEGDAVFSERRRAGLQAVCGERCVQAFCRGYGNCNDEPSRHRLSEASKGCAHSFMATGAIPPPDALEWPWIMAALSTAWSHASLRDSHY